MTFDPNQTNSRVARELAKLERHERQLSIAEARIAERNPNRAKRVARQRRNIRRTIAAQRDQLFS